MPKTELALGHIVSVPEAGVSFWWLGRSVGGPMSVSRDAIGLVPYALPCMRVMRKGSISIRVLVLRVLAMGLWAVIR